MRMTKLRKDRRSNPDAARFLTCYRYPLSRQEEWRLSLKVFTGLTGILMQPLGLASYITVDLPERLPDGNQLPDYLPGRISREGYPSRKAWQLSREANGRKAFYPAHHLVFDMEQSFSGFPELYRGRVLCGKAQYILENSVDWQNGSTAVYLGLRPSSMSVESFLQHLKKAYDKFLLLDRLSEHYGINAIETFQTEDFVVLFEHRPQSQKCNWSTADYLSEFSQPLVQEIAVKRELAVSPASRLAEAEFLPTGNCYDFRFEQVEPPMGS